MCDWVPVDWADPPAQPGDPELVTAVGDIDLDALDDALPWHVKTKFEGNFT
jgi:hypothetical protein